MTTDNSKSNKIRLKTSDSIDLIHRNSSSYNTKSTDCLFKPIVTANDITSPQRKPPSPFQTGLKYLKLLGQLKRQNENNSIDIHHIKPININRLERTSAFSTNYYAPLPPLCSHLTNKSIQVDDLDELSYKTAINNNYSYLSFYEFLFTFISFLFFIFIILYIQLNFYPIHCLLNKKFWSHDDLLNGFICENTNIEIHYIQIYSIIYQIEIEKNNEARNCLGFNILSCLPIVDYSLLPKGQKIYRNDQLFKYCNYTEKFNCYNHALSILPYEYKWNLKNNQFNELFHCSCLTYLNNNTECFHFMIIEQCDLQIPYFDYCLKYSSIHSTCQAYLKKL